MKQKPFFLVWRVKLVGEISGLNRVRLKTIIVFVLSEKDKLLNDDNS